MSSISLGAKNKKTGKTYNVRHKNQGWKIKTTGGREKVHNDDQKGKEKGHNDYQTELVDDTDDIYEDDYQNESNESNESKFKPMNTIATLTCYEK